MINTVLVNFEVKIPGQKLCSVIHVETSKWLPLFSQLNLEEKITLAFRSHQSVSSEWLLAKRFKVLTVWSNWTYFGTVQKWTRYLSVSERNWSVCVRRILTNSNQATYPVAKDCEPKDQYSWYLRPATGHDSEHGLSTSRSMYFFKIHLRHCSGPFGPIYSASYAMCTGVSFLELKAAMAWS